jgi:hypothetical protein
MPADLNNVSFGAQGFSQDLAQGDIVFDQQHGGHTRPPPASATVWTLARPVLDATMRGTIAGGRSIGHLQECIQCRRRRSDAGQLTYQVIQFSVVARDGRDANESIVRPSG